MQVRGRDRMSAHEQAKVYGYCIVTSVNTSFEYSLSDYMAESVECVSVCICVGVYTTLWEKIVKQTAVARSKMTVTQYNLEIDRQQLYLQRISKATTFSVPLNYMPIFGYVF